MRKLRLDPKSKKDLLSQLLKRSPNQYESYELKVNQIIETVRTRKDEALFEYTLAFDKACIHSDNILVTEEEIQAAYDEVDPKLLEVIRKAAKNIEI